MYWTTKMFIIMHKVKRISFGVIDGGGLQKDSIFFYLLSLNKFGFNSSDIYMNKKRGKHSTEHKSKIKDTKMNIYWLSTLHQLKAFIS